MDFHVGLWPLFPFLFFFFLPYKHADYFKILLHWVETAVTSHFHKLHRRDYEELKSNISGNSYIYDRAVIQEMMPTIKLSLIDSYHEGPIFPYLLPKHLY